MEETPTPVRKATKRFHAEVVGGVGVEEDEDDDDDDVEGAELELLALDDGVGGDDEDGIAGIAPEAVPTSNTFSFVEGTMTSEAILGGDAKQRWDVTEQDRAVFTRRGNV